MAIKAQGTQLYILDDTDTGNEVTEFPCLTTIGSSSPTRAKIDTTCLTSEGKEYVLGLVDFSSFPVGFIYDPQDAAYAKVRALEGGDPVRVVMGLSESQDPPTFAGGTFTLPTTRTWVDFNSLIESVDRGEATVDNVFNGTITLAPTGGETETAAA